MKNAVLGWDVGGANIKAALVGQELEPRNLERAFALWREPDRLPMILTEMAAALGGAPSSMAITMTAELADCFATKKDGVSFVLDAFRSAFPRIQPLVYAVDGRFRSLEEAAKEPLLVAAANWHASATVVARTHADALFVDVGSTTTDVVPIIAGRIAARGTTDPARLLAGELVYTGALRTPVCAVVRRVPVGGRLCRVAAEVFAIAADVHVWLGAIDSADYTCETPDGRGRTRAEAGARLARMVCADLDMLEPAGATAIAEHVARAQVTQIANGMRQVVRRLGPASPRLALLAGRGAFLGRRAAVELGFEPRDLIDEMGRAALVAPAAAVACLFIERAAIDTTAVSHHSGTA